MWMWTMKKLLSAHRKRALWAGMPEVGAEPGECVECAIAIAGKPAPTVLCRTQKTGATQNL
jgi:hypothetical protein